MFAQSRCNEADGAPGSAAEQAPSRCGQLDPGRFMDIPKTEDSLAGTIHPGSLPPPGNPIERPQGHASGNRKRYQALTIMRSAKVEDPS